MLKMKWAGVAIMMVAWGVTSAAVRGEIMRVTVQPVSDLKAEGAVWNLASASPAGTEFDIIIAQDDSLWRAWLPDTRFDYLTEGDTLVLTCEETRRFKVVFTPASPEIIRGRQQGVCVSSLTGHGRIYQSEYLIVEGESAVAMPERVTLIGFTGDTITGARLDRAVRTLRWTISRDSSAVVPGPDDPGPVWTTRIERLRLTAPGEEFPRAMKKVVTTSCDGGEEAVDSTSWVMTTPPDMARVDTPTPPDKSHPGNLTLPLPGSAPAVSLSVDDDAITVVPAVAAPGTPGFSGNLRVAVNDITGRSFMDCNIPADAQSTVSTAGLPRGEYLIQVLDGATPVAVMKYIKD